MLYADFFWGIPVFTNSWDIFIRIISISVSFEQGKLIANWFLQRNKQFCSALSIFFISFKYFFGRELAPKPVYRYQKLSGYNTDKSFIHFRKPLGQLKGSVDHIIAVHAKLVDVGGLHPDSEDEINLPISSADKRASWSRSKSRSRTESVTSTSVMSNSAAYKVRQKLFFVCLLFHCKCLKSI